MYRSRIIGTGSALPAREVDNTTIGQPLGLSSEAVFRRTGIRTRRWASEEETPSLLGERAARQALDAAGLRPGQLDGIIVSTTSPDTPCPATACHIQRRLGVPPALAFDVAASCSGFLYAAAMADCLIRSGQCRYCLVVAAEVKSRFLDPADEATAMLFADGAGAAVLTGTEESHGAAPGVLGVRLYADGARHGLISMAAGGSRRPVSADTVRDGAHVIRLVGGPLFRVAVRTLAGAVQDVLKEFGVGVGDLEQVVFHQANGRLLEAIRTRLHLPAERMYSVIERYGNASSASLPIALDHAARDGMLTPGHLCLLGSFGGGLTWATALVRW